MKIGVYGGTFNPPHLGHLAAARTASELLGLDLLYLVPTGLPPHKELPPGSPAAAQRLEMTRLAADSLGARARVLQLETDRAGRSYTADTLSALRAMHPDDTLWLLMGTDMFRTFQDWREPERILACAGLAAFGRTASEGEEALDTQAERLYRRFPGARIFTMTVPDVIDVSSTELRDLLARGEGARFLPPAVYGYILRKGLYGTRADLKHLPLSRLRPAALSYLDRRRIPHVLGTEQEAARLAVRYGADVEKARRAALLHDCTKRLHLEAHLALCERYGIRPDEQERGSGKLLHAVTGAAVARDVFGLDEEAAAAVRWHTTGRAGMSKLEKILYLADYIEPSRDFPGVDALRGRVYEDLDAGLLMGLELSVEELEARGDPVHRATLEARDALKGLR